MISTNTPQSSKAGLPLVDPAPSSAASDEEEYRELVENINQGLFVVEHGILKLISNHAMRMFGYSRQEMLGMKAWELVCAEKADEIQKCFIKKTDETYTAQWEVECRRKDGSLFWAEMSLRGSSNGRVYGSVVDITLRKAITEAHSMNEKRLTLALQSTKAGLWDWDMKTDEMVFDTYWADMLGYTLDELEPCLATWKSMVHPDDITLFQKALEDYLQGRKPLYRCAFRMKTKTGDWLYILGSGMITDYDKAGNPIRMVGTHQNITKQKNSEKQLREINATKDKLFSIIAHDLRSPYNAQLGFLETLLEEESPYSPGERKRIIHYLYNSTRQSFALLDNLLIWSRANAGKIAFRPEVLLVAQLFEDVTEIQRYSAQAKNITIEFSLPDDNMEVTADSEMTDTILRNLVSNAIKFTPEGGCITLSAMQGDPLQTVIKVTDNGVGIPAERVPLLFDAESNYSTVGTQQERGTGLGLIVCREFVERNGGKIWVQSAPGKGSTFYFTLNSTLNSPVCYQSCIHNFSEIFQHINGNKQLYRDFHDRVIPQFKDCHKHASTELIQAFIGILQQIATLHRIVPLQNFCGVIAKSLQADDRNQINICFTEFEKLIGQMELLMPDLT
ncbi:MAG: PAS domain S-box protein [Bacteroidales bacterium]|jgi:PAS domain S-box-containing protein|nr:PAS domain S-box protein [Bacteroidales bacterium]MDY0335189.1 PAS domain S-box protein [Bacteroidales bacterium]NCU35236.1 PAS domain S-box protein [Candidatus Falkowbacteria bacterium]